MRLLALLTLCASSLPGLGCQSTSNGTASGIMAASLETSPSSARYHGYVKLPHRSTRLPATLDLVRVGDAPEPTYLGFFRMSAGGFDSHEYVTLYYPNVRFDAATGTLTFGGGPEDTRLEGVTLTAAGIKGSVASDKEKVTTPFELEVDRGDGNPPIAFDGMPIASHLTGHYVAECGEQREVLQLEASRWRGRRATDGSLFGGYRIYGRRGHFDEVICGDRDKACVSDTYPSVSVDFLARTLELKNDGAECRVQGSKITCDGPCAFVKDAATPHTVLDVVREEERHERTFHLPADDVAQDPKGRGGQYYGYLHHEGRDAYQLIALNVKAAPEVDLTGSDSKRGREHVAAVATLYFGQGDSSEFVAYRFKETLTPAPGQLGAAAAVVFEGDGEAIFVVEDWSAKVVRGTWYGKTYGRVGTVELTRDLVPELDPRLPTVPSLAGLYRGDGWDFEIAASANLSEEPTAFYPLKIFGWARERLDSSRRRSIEDGAYDFYTGALAFRLDDGRTVLGQVGAKGFELHWAPVPRLGSPLTTAEYRTFKRIGDLSGPQAKLERR